MKKIVNFTKTIIIILVVLLGLGFSIGTFGGDFQNAIVYIDLVEGVYFSPLSVTEEIVESKNLIQITKEEAENLGYKMSEEDKQNGYFSQEGRSLTGMLLERIGILPPLLNRIDENGNWRY